MPSRVPEMLAHYKVLEQVDEGGMGVVYRALNTHLNCDVALKILPERALEDPDARRRLRHEAQILSKLHNPHVAVVHDYDRQDDIDFMVLEYVPGITLSDRIGTGPLPETQVLDYGIQLADGMVAAHEQGLVHCDIKPRNIRITPDGQVKLLDFGLARYLRPVHDDSTTRSITEQGPFGTPPYMAPEMVSEGRVDPRVDIYSFGAVLYEMATGRRPFDETTPGRLVHAILYETPPEPRVLVPRLSPGLENLILKALDKDPERRYQSAREMLVDLARLRNPTTPSAVWRPPPRVPRRAWVAAAFGLSAVLTGILIVVLQGRSSDDRLPRGRDLLPVVSWPGEKLGSRLSPDGRWVSFVARRDDRYGLWLRKMPLSDPRLVHSFTGALTSHAWSPDGEQIAILLVERAGVYLRGLPSQGGPPLWSLQMEPVFEDGRLARWIGANVYIEVPRRGLWSVGLGTGETTLVMPAEATNNLRLDFDVHPDTRRLLFTQREPERRSLWTCALDGSDLRPVRPDVEGDGSGRWAGGSTDRLVFSTTRGSSPDIWSVRVGGRGAVRLTFGVGSERLEDAANDGSAITFAERRDVAALWLLPARHGLEPRQLTFENAVDLWPTASAAGNVTIFQRAEVAFPDSSLYGSRLYRLQLGTGDGAVATPIPTPGGEAVVSPEGRFVACVRWGRSRQPELWITDLETEHSRRIAIDVTIPRLHRFPLDRAERTTAWSGAGPTLFWVSRHETHHDIHRWVRGGPENGERWIEDRGAAWLADLRVSPDDRRLAWVRTGSAGTEPLQVRCRDLDGGEERTVLSLAPRDSCGLSLFGWIDDRTLLVARVRTQPDWTDQLELAALHLTGSEHPLGSIDGAFAGTACLDRHRQTLLLTCAGEAALHNVHSFDLETRRLSDLTRNRLQGVTFSGITSLADGSTLFVRHELTESVWYVPIDNPD